MKKIILLLFFIGFTSNAYAEVIPSIEKIFKEKVKTIKEGDLFYGCIFFITYGDEDLFTRKEKIYSIKIGNSKEFAELTVKDFNDLSKGDVKAPKVGDCYAFMSLMNAPVMVVPDKKMIYVRVKLYLEDYTVGQNIIKRILKDELTIDEYFEDGINYGQKRIKLTGTVDKMFVAGDGNLAIDLVSKQGNIITAWYMKFDWENNDSIKNHLRSIKTGDNIQLKGFFETEIGETAFFSIQSVIEQ